MRSANDKEFEYSYLGVLFLGLAFLWKVRQSISRNISFSLTIINLEVISRELLGSTDLTRAQAFHIHESTEDVMVSKDEDHVFAALQVVTPSFESLNDG